MFETGFKPTMAGAESVDESKLKGFSKYFNSYTDRGRYNWALACLAFYGTIGAYLVLRRNKPKPEAAAKK